MNVAKLSQFSNIKNTLNVKFAGMNCFVVNLNPKEAKMKKKATNRIYLTLTDEKLKELETFATERGLTLVSAARMVLYEELGRKQ